MSSTPLTRRALAVWQAFLQGYWTGLLEKVQPEFFRCIITAKFRRCLVGWRCLLAGQDLTLVEVSMDVRRRPLVIELNGCDAVSLVRVGRTPARALFPQPRRCELCGVRRALATTQIWSMGRVTNPPLTPIFADIMTDKGGAKVGRSLVSNLSFLARARCPFLSHFA